MSEPSDLYQHSPLDLSKPATRVVRLSSERSEDGLLQLHMYHIPKPSGHIAVSYVWGTDEPSDQVLINGKAFFVRNNLFSFLQQMFATRTTTIPFWIDAICLDQSNVRERNHQVGQMGRIYRDAHQVFCWLGQGTSDDAVSKFLESRCQVRLGRDVAENAMLLPLHCVFLDSVYSLRDFDNIKACIILLGGSSYFTRTWVVPEYLSNDKTLMIYGKFALHWSSMHSLAHYSKYLEDVPFLDSCIRILQMTRRAIGDGGEKFTLTKLLANTSTTQCTDPRDRIYSALSLFGSDIAVDYSIDTLKLLLNTWSETSERYQDLSILIKALSLDHRILEDPRWIRNAENKGCNVVYALHSYPSTISITLCVCTECLEQTVALLSGKYRLRAVKSIEDPRTEFTVFESPDDDMLIVAFGWTVTNRGRKQTSVITPSFMAPNEKSVAPASVDWEQNTLSFSLLTASKILYSVLRVPFAGVLAPYPDTAEVVKHYGDNKAISATFVDGQLHGPMSRDTILEIVKD
jgi:hypothetical protein